MTFFFFFFCLSFKGPYEFLTIKFNNIYKYHILGGKKKKKTFQKSKGGHGPRWPKGTIMALSLFFGSLFFLYVSIIIKHFRAFPESNQTNKN